MLEIFRLAIVLFTVGLSKSSYDGVWMAEYVQSVTPFVYCAQGEMMVGRSGVYWFDPVVRAQENAKRPIELVAGFMPDLKDYPVTLMEGARTPTTGGVCFIYSGGYGQDHRGRFEAFTRGLEFPIMDIAIIVMGF